MDYVFGTTPFAHQLHGFEISRDLEYYALLMEQGTGKTKLAIDTSCYLYNQGKIEAMLVVAPNGVNRVWILEELPKHMPEYIHYIAAWYASSPKAAERDALKAIPYAKNKLKVVSINIEALATKKGVAFVKGFLMMYKTMFIIDESSTIKNPKAVRTKNLLKLAKHSAYRRILTGTPVTQSPLDIYTQFAFMDPTILRTSSYYAFRNRYAILREAQVLVRGGTRSFMQVVGYNNLDELTKLIAPHSYRVVKKDCLDLPDKLYQKRHVPLSVKQALIYKTLKKEVVAEFEGAQMSATLALTKLLRMQQVVGGFFTPDMEVGESVAPVAQAIDDKNARVEEVINILRETQGKAIIWARFRAEIAAIVRRIKEEFGNDSVVEYHGGVDNASRSENITRFQDSENKALYFVGNVQAGGKGITLHAASTMIYYSNSFSLEDRLQSEDRAHRIGQTKNVTYIDIIAPSTLDEKVVGTLRDKKNMADMITGDEPLKSWL